MNNIQELVDGIILKFFEETNLRMFYSDDEIESIRYNLETQFMDTLVAFMNGEDL